MLFTKNILNRTDKRGFTSPSQWYEKNMREYISDKINRTEFIQCHFFDGKKLKEDYQNDNIFKTNNSSDFCKILISILSFIK